MATSCSPRPWTTSTRKPLFPHKLFRSAHMWASLDPLHCRHVLHVLKHAVLMGLYTPSSLTEMPGMLQKSARDWHALGSVDPAHSSVVLVLLLVEDAVEADVEEVAEVTVGVDVDDDVLLVDADEVVVVVEHAVVPSKNWKFASNLTVFLRPPSPPPCDDNSHLLAASLSLPANANAAQSVFPRHSAAQSARVVDVGAGALDAPATRPGPALLKRKAQMAGGWRHAALSAFLRYMS